MRGPEPRMLMLLGESQDLFSKFTVCRICDQQVILILVFYFICFSVSFDVFVLNSILRAKNTFNCKSIFCIYVVFFCYNLLDSDSYYLMSRPSPLLNPTPVPPTTQVVICSTFICY